jgi:hypothetical protein
MIASSLLLRRALLGDAVFSGTSAALIAPASGAIAPILELPEGLLREIGLFLIVYTVLVAWLSARQTVPKALVMIVIVGNAAWTLASIALLLSGLVSPNLFGQAVIVAQAITTGVLAELQYIGLRRSQSMAIT